MPEPRYATVGASVGPYVVAAKCDLGDTGTARDAGGAVTHMTERDLDLAEVALESAVMACRHGDPELAAEYATALDHLMADRQA